MSGNSLSRIARSNRLAFAVLGMALVASMSSAAVVVHDNADGTFEWKRSFSISGGEDILGTFLDITQPPTQSGTQKAGSFGRWFFPNMSGSEPGLSTIVGEGTAQSARTGDFVQLDWNGKTINVIPTREFYPGEVVGGSANWQGISLYFFHNPFFDDFVNGAPAISTLAYVGVRIKASNSYRYGWILLEDYTKPVMWAYETQIGVPIQIPVPAPSNVIFATVFTGIYVRRRRSTRLSLL
jgi:hypothetical protein